MGPLGRGVVVDGCEKVYRAMKRWWVEGRGLGRKVESSEHRSCQLCYILAWHADMRHLIDLCDCLKRLG